MTITINEQNKSILIGKKEIQVRPQQINVLVFLYKRKHRLTLQSEISKHLFDSTDYPAIARVRTLVHQINKISNNRNIIFSRWKSGVRLHPEYEFLLSS